MLPAIWPNLRQRFEPYLLLGIFTLALLSLGAAIGMVVEKYRTYEAAGTIEPFPENISREIPLLFLEKIENGVLYGRNEGAEIRFVIGPKHETIVSEDSGAFQFSVTEILPLLKRIPAPAGMNYVASARGTKFWPLDAPEAALITAKNRVFFPDRAAATRNGYTPGK